LFHLYKIPMVNTPIGTPKDPVAVCSNCHSLSCGWHGVLTTKHAFLCVLCSQGLLLSGAMWRWFNAGGLKTLPSDDGMQPAPEDGAARAYHLALMLGSLFLTPAGTPSRLVVTTLKQWLDQRPDYERLMNYLLEGGLAAEAVDMISDLFGVGPEPAYIGQERVDPSYEDNDDGVRSLWARLDHESRLMVAAAVILMIALDPNRETLRGRLPQPVLEIYDRLGGRLRDSPKVNEFCEYIIKQEAKG
jgi:hypothetical protein